jgi:DNA-binding response OmpR family regulator
MERFRRRTKGAGGGCDEYLPKPYSPSQLLAKIRQNLLQ